MTRLQRRGQHPGAGGGLARRREERGGACARAGGGADGLWACLPVLALRNLEYGIDNSKWYCFLDKLFMVSHPFYYNIPHLDLYQDISLPKVELFPY